MTEDEGPYRRHSFDESEQCVHVEITRVPEGWEPILNPKRSGTTLVAALVAVLVWVIVAFRTMTLLAG